MLVAFGILRVVQGERAMLPTRLLRVRNVWVSGVYGVFFAGSYFVPLYYLPLYFQGVEDVSPTGSGVRNLPLIIAFSLATIASGISITKTGIATPILPVGSEIAIVSAGLLYTLDIETGEGKWFGYQILAGFAYGIAFQVPIIVCQSTVDPRIFGRPAGRYPSCVHTGYQGYFRNYCCGPGHLLSTQLA